MSHPNSSLAANPHEVALHQYREAVLALWRAQADGASPKVVGMDRMPLFASAPVAGPLDVLFVGLNPSFDQRMLARHWVQCFGAPYPDGDDPLAWRSEREGEVLQTLVDRLAVLDDHSRRHYGRYYGGIEALAAGAGAAARWHVFDTFPIRASLQSDLRLSEAHRHPQGHPMRSLLEAFAELVAAWRPRVVVVLNRGASMLLARTLDLRQDHSGCGHRWAKAPGTRWLLSRMLTSRHGSMSEEERTQLQADIGKLLTNGERAES